MNINKYISALTGTALALLLLVASGCSEEALEEEPRTFLSQDAVFSSREGVIAATSGIYKPFHQDNLYGWWLLGNLELFSDYIYGRGSQAPASRYEMGSTGISRVGNIWRGGYQVINRANLVISQLESREIEGVDAELKNRLIGEARFLRALAYFHLVRLFGDVPLRLEPETQDFAIGRSPESEVYDQIIEDLQFGEQNLPDVYPAAELGRATRWAASSILSKVYLTLSRWDEAAAKAKEVIESGQFSLVEVSVPEDFQKIFGADVTTHSEEIFSLKHARIPGLGFAPLWLMHRAGSGYSLGNNAHAWFGNLDSWLGDWVKQLDGPDLRPNDWIYNGPHDEQYLSEEVPLLFKKFRDTESDPPGNDFPVIRYTEVLLIFAEADAMANNAPTAEAYEYLNQVRRRAYGRDINTPDAEADFPAGLTAQQFQDSLLLERGKEFVMEGKRWYDLLRTGKTLEVVRASGDGKAGIQDRDLKWPIPAEEIDNNDALSQSDQNSGW
uniref:RagB/SusD family nutrient uptake outer membrane protein n=1 Tax=Roseihalotalea indica TaxID=2867963 RepID=A0AA49GG63_9BACT|nr:RagB/SusD family nutrient uptake outer membrane protein [Tunicatimonas sp. TK19036]